MVEVQRVVATLPVTDHNPYSAFNDGVETVVARGTKRLSAQPRSPSRVETAARGWLPDKLGANLAAARGTAPTWQTVSKLHGSRPGSVTILRPSMGARTGSYETR